jgi:hypothetical protein
VRFAFIAAREVAFPVDTMCRVLSVSRSGYYAWSKRPVTAVKAADVLLVAEIAGAHRAVDECGLDSCITPTAAAPSGSRGRRNTCSFHRA